jgi:hypothetical protein
MVRAYGETDDLVTIILRALLLFFAIPLIGGLAWGFGIAFLMQADAKKLSRTGALNWGVGVLIAGLVLYVIMAFGPQITAVFPFPVSVHTFFNLLFVPTIGVAVAIVVRNITASLGMDHLKNIAGKNSGLAAALGFLIVSLVLQFGFGWEVGRPVWGKYSMITIMHWGNFGAALAGGAMMGWIWSRDELSELESSFPTDPEPVKQINFE